MLKNLQSLFPFTLMSLGFALIALVLNMPLFEWQISDIVTDLPQEVHVNPTWITRLGDSFESGSYNASDGSYIFYQILVPQNGISCSPEQLTAEVRRTRSNEMLERIALGVNQGTVLLLTGLTMTGQITMGVLLFLCGIYIWWFTIWNNRPIAEAFFSTVVATILLSFLINILRFLVPETGVFVCRPELYGTVTFSARLSKIHFETLLVFFVAIVAEAGAIGVMLHQVRRATSKRNAGQK